ncbi:MAG: hypothetical protein M1816_006599 [Peltula sp. TS41687]|nr:MAG: hypothetical protein M1816_006599 [Peltula sp. TS41687]
MPLQQARVKSVSSGDTLVLSSLNNATQERLLSLAFVSAPRLKKEGDEPHAFQSRDFLRRLTVGKVIQFQVVYTISPPNGKKVELGRIMLSPTGPILPDLAAEKGWVKIRENAERNAESEEAAALLEKLKSLEAKARLDSAGLWSSAGETIETKYDLSEPQGFIEQWKGHDVDAIAERVLTGDRLLLRLLLEPTKHQQAVVVIAGIRAPMTKRAGTAEGKEQPAEEGGEEARTFIEDRLLQRTVKVDVVGLTPQNQPVAVVKHPTQGSIAEHILKAGLARCSDSHSTMLGGNMASLRQAEKFAKSNKQGLFKNHAGQKSAAGSMDAIVSRVQSADTLYVRNKAGAEKRVSLSSIRQPKPSDPAQAPFCAEAKEFLRKRLIGKHVTVDIDATRPAQEGFEAREMATVTFGNNNVGLLLVENGWASVIRHRRDDEDRSPIYDELLAAEEAAQKEQKGMWAKKPPASKSYTDASESTKAAKIHLSVLQRQRKVPAVVDFVKSGSRFTVLIPRENLKLTFVLSGVRAPKTARNPSEKSDPFGQEAHDFAVRRCNQRDVEIDVENIDKVGGFIGTLYVNRENFAKALVEEGLAQVHAYSAEQSGHANELFAAETKAKEARKGLWHGWDPDMENGETDQQEGPDVGTNGANGDSTPPSERKKDYRDVVVTNIDETCKLKLQQIGTGTAALTEMMTAFKAFHMNKANDKPLTDPPKAGDFVAARFSADGDWYRARVRHNDREHKSAEVLYIDYGNTEKQAWAQLRPLSQPQFSVQKLKGQAVDAVLSFLQFPTQHDYLADAVHFLRDLTGDKQLVANVDHVDPDGTLHVTLFDPTASSTLQESLNADLVAEGLAMVPRKLKAWERAGSDVLASLKAKEEEAKRDRKGMWEYGDLTED